MALLHYFPLPCIPGFRVPPEVFLPGDLQWADLWPDGTLHDDPPPEGEHEEGGLCGQTHWNLCHLSAGGLRGQPTLTNFPHFSLLSASNLRLKSDTVWQATCMLGKEISLVYQPEIHVL